MSKTCDARQTGPDTQGTRFSCSQWRRAGLHGEGYIAGPALCSTWLFGGGVASLRSRAARPAALIEAMQFYAAFPTLCGSLAPRTSAFSMDGGTARSSGALANSALAMGPLR